jgi:apolipoprotein N-acyltransferase
VTARAGWAWIGLALISGGVWGLCFGRSPLLLAPWLALVPFLLLLAKTARPWRIGWLHGVATWCVALPWVVPTLVTYGGLHWTLAVIALALLAAYLGLFHALFGGLAARLWRRGGWRTFLGIPALWVALEWLRGHALSGFPWNLAAYAVTETPGVLPLSAWVGAWGVSFLVVFVNLALAAALLRRRALLAGFGYGAALVLLAVAGRFAVPLNEERAAATPVRIVQPNTPNLVQFDATRVMEHYRELIKLSREACDRPGTLVVWPESAAWPMALDRDETLRADLAVLNDLGCSVLLNSPRQVGESLFNAAYLIAPGRAAQFADKRHLVPFGEYVPMADWLPFLGTIARNAGSFQAAEKLQLLGDPKRSDSAAAAPSRGERYGVAICFEVIFPGEVAELTRAGATAFVTVTNDAWFGESAAPWQHFRAARFRAAENRRPLVRAAITGVSGLISESGQVVAQLGPGEKGILRGELRGRSSRTPFSRAPWLVPLGSSLVAAFAIMRRR